MVTISHQMYLFLMGEGSLDGTWFGDNPCPAVAKGAFWWRSALRRYATRPTADLGDDGELVKRLRAPAYWMSGSSDGHEGENYAPLEAADRLILYREARELLRDSRTALQLAADFIPESQSLPELVKRIDAVLSRSGG